MERPAFSCRLVDVLTPSSSSNALILLLVPPRMGISADMQCGVVVVVVDLRKPFLLATSWGSGKGVSVTGKDGWMAGGGVCFCKPNSVALTPVVDGGWAI